MEKSNTYRKAHICRCRAERPYQDHRFGQRLSEACKDHDAAITLAYAYEARAASKEGKQRLEDLNKALEAYKLALKINPNSKKAQEKIPELKIETIRLKKDLMFQTGPPQDIPFRMTMKRTFAIGDIHGCLDQLEDLVHRIEPHKDDLLVFLGIISTEDRASRR